MEEPGSDPNPSIDFDFDVDRGNLEEEREVVDLQREEVQNLELRDSSYSTDEKQSLPQQLSPPPSSSFSQIPFPRN